MNLVERFRSALAGFKNQTNAVKSSDPKVIDLLGAAPAASGVYVTPDSAMRVAAVYACVSKIAGGISTLPCHVYERTWDPNRRRYSRIRVEDANTYWLLNEQPCQGWTAASMWERVTEYELLRGDAFAYIVRDSYGVPKEIVPLDRDAVEPAYLTEQIGSRLYYKVNDGLKIRGIDQDDILHFPGFGFNGLTSRSVISWAARNAAGNAIAMDEYSGRFFAGGAHPSIVLQTDKKVSEDQQKLLRDNFAAKHSGLPNAHRLPLILTEGIQAKEVSINAQDAQLLEARQFTVIDIARAFGVPPHMIGETSSSTSWGSGIEAMSRAFVQYTLQPHLVRIEQELNRKLYRTYKRFVEFDREASLQGDSKAQAEYFRAALGGPGSGGGWMSKNEVRQAKNLPPVDGGDQIFDPAPTGPGSANA